jgi:hypothetical protein
MHCADCLIVNGTVGCRWLSLLQDAIQNLGGRPKVVAERDLDKDDCLCYSLVVLDSTAVANTAQAVAGIHAKNPSAAIVVFSDIPDWRRERDCYRAGACVCGIKRFNGCQVRAELQRALGCGQACPFRECRGCPNETHRAAGRQ